MLYFELKYFLNYNISAAKPAEGAL